MTRTRRRVLAELAGKILFGGRRPRHGADAVGEGTGKGVAMTGAATLLLGGDLLARDPSVLAALFDASQN